MATDLTRPYDRIEMYLANIANLWEGIPAKPYSRKEMYLAAIAVHMNSIETDIADLQSRTTSLEGRMDVAEQKIAAMATDMKYKGSVEDFEHLPTDAQKGDVYTTRDDGKEYVFDGEMWVEIGKVVDVRWGAIIGDLEDQEDLQEALDEKQDVLTQGFGIVLSDNTISVDDVDVATVEYVDANITDTMNFIIQERDTERAARIAGDDLINAKTGELEDLETEDKSNLVAAINEAASKGGAHPYLSLERNGEYLYTVTFDKLPEENEADEPVVGECSSFVRDGKLYRNLDWNYDENASFRVITKDFEGMAFIGGLTDGNMDDEKIAQLPYRVSDGVNKHGIMVSTHVLYNDWNWAGTGNTPLTRLPYYVLTHVKSMDTFETDLGDILSDLYVPEAMAALGYLLQVLVTDGETTYVIMPPTLPSDAFTTQEITSNPKLTNFRWVSDALVSRTALQTHPTGVERWNLIGDDTRLEDLRFTVAYESPVRLSEFIGINGTTKDSTDAELEAIYNEAHSEYATRERDGETWQTMHSVVYGPKGMEVLNVQEDFAKNYIGSTQSGGGTWGSIEGDINDQTDLKNALDNKQDTLIVANGVLYIDVLHPTSISLTPKTNTVDLNATKQLVTTVLPEEALNKDVTYESSNPESVTVDENGLITAVGDGSATITATTVDGGLTDTASVQVHVPLRGISVTPTSVDLHPGDTTQINVTYDPDNASDKRVTYRIYSGSGSGVNGSGLISAYANGTTTIRTTSSEGGYWANTTVRVTTPLRGISLDQTSAAVFVGNTLQLNVIFDPATASDKAVTFTSSNTAVATVSSTGLVTGVSLGNAVITATSHDGGFTATCAIECAEASGFGNVTYYDPADMVLNFTEEYTDGLEIVDGAKFIAAAKVAMGGVPYNTMDDWGQSPRISADYQMWEGSLRMFYESSSGWGEWSGAPEDAGINVTGGEWGNGTWKLEQIEVGEKKTVQLETEDELNLMVAPIDDDGYGNLVVNMDRNITLGEDTFAYGYITSFAFASLPASYTYPDYFLCTNRIESVSNAERVRNVGNNFLSGMRTNVYDEWGADPVWDCYCDFSNIVNIGNDFMAGKGGPFPNVFNAHSIGSGFLGLGGGGMMESEHPFTGDSFSGTFSNLTSLGNNFFSGFMPDWRYGGAFTIDLSFPVLEEIPEGFMSSMNNSGGGREVDLSVELGGARTIHKYVLSNLGYMTGWVSKIEIGSNWSAYSDDIDDWSCVCGGAGTKSINEFIVHSTSIPEYSNSGEFWNLEGRISGEGADMFMEKYPNDGSRYLYKEEW